jgi:carbon-monoxide dehydrogenase small subunit
MAVTVKVNGATRSVNAEPDTPLLYVLRNDLELNGAKFGCGLAQCGACTVLIDGAPARSCITHAGTCDGAVVRTIEGFGDDAVMAALHEAFAREHALQCGYCTPGMLIAARDVVLRLPDADEARVREELSGNLCRGIVRAVLSVLANLSSVKSHTDG